MYLYDTWEKTYLVGDITIAPVPFQVFQPSRTSNSTAGIKNPSVLPLPVFADAKTSRPYEKMRFLK